MIIELRDIWNWIEVLSLSHPHLKPCYIARFVTPRIPISITALSVLMTHSIVCAGGNIAAQWLQHFLCHLFLCKRINSHKVPHHFYANTKILCRAHADTLYYESFQWKQHIIVGRLYIRLLVRMEFLHARSIYVRQIQ